MPNTFAHLRFFSTRSTFVRVMIPVVIILLLVTILMARLSYLQAKSVYENLQAETLTNTLQTSRNLLVNNLPEDYKTEEVANTMAQNLSQASIPSGVGLFVMSNNSRLLFNKGVGNFPEIQNHLSYFYRFADSAAHRLVTSKGEIIVGMHIPSRSLFVAAYTPQSFTTTPQYNKIIEQMLIAFPIGALMATMFIYIVLRLSLLLPLDKLGQAMRESIRTESFSTRVPPKGSAEPQTLARQFNTMLAELNARDKTLKNYAETLEEQVKQRTDELVTTQDKLVLHERLAAIGEFASAIVHELRNPLSAIKMGVDQLKLSEEGNEKNNRRLSLAQQQIDRLDDMLSGILTFAASRPTQVENFPITELLKQTEDMIQAYAKNKELSLRFLGFDQSAEVIADRNKLQQALLNILKNACEHAPDKSEVTAVVSSKPKHIHISVNNKGEPISEEMQHRLFEPFFTTKKGGTGLGLPTTRKLMQEMGGEITLTSDAENGTTVTLILNKEIA
ncbi:MAG: hypothetical protein CMF62_11710 [Magnetococcales bacterium]|nr:hypothetical protein [Magnetococcales bacterium]